jgi:hypothetical protein
MVKNKLHFNEMMMRSALYHPELLAPFPKFFHLEKGARSSGWLQLKYSSGVIPGKPLKRKSMEEETLARKRKYELSRERKFLSVWQSGRPWLFILVFVFSRIIKNHLIH